MAEARPDLELRAFAPGAFAHKPVCLECAAQQREPRPVAVTLRVPIRHSAAGKLWAYSYIDLCRQDAIALLRGTKEILDRANLG